MKKSIGLTAQVFGLAALAAWGCGGDGGGGGVLDGGRGGAGGSGSGGAPGSSQCRVPSCFLDVISTCVPQGACKMRSSATGLTTCYQNGVKEIVGVDLATKSSSYTVTRPDGTTCWTYSLPYSSTGALPDKVEITYKDGAGVAFATLSYDRKTGAIDLACPGGPPQSLLGACAGVMMGGDPGGTADQCEEGVCP
jgi:hypothetical protein